MAALHAPERTHPPTRTSRHGSRSLRWQDRTLLVLAIALLSLVLLRIETAAAQPSEWGLELSTDAGSVVGLALHTRITVEVTGLIARVAVSQRFANHGLDWAEGTYRYPLPDGAAVDRLLVQVGERLVEGEIREKEDARRVYQHAAAAGQTASLVEQQRVNQFETRLANIAPGEEIEVHIGFLARVNLDEGTYSLRLPMTFTPRWESPGLWPLDVMAGAPHFAAAAGASGPALEVDVLLRTGLAFSAIHSQYHDVDIEAGPDGYRVTLAEPDAAPNRDFLLTWAPELTAEPQSALLTWDGGDALYAQLLIVPPLPEAIAPQPREVVFIIDTSGSMQGPSIEQARSALLQGLDELGPDDLFNLIRFNSRTESLFEASMPVNGHSLFQAIDFIDSLVADGGTVMAPALQAALSLPETPGLLRQLVFITDGSVGNEHELLLLVAEGLGDSRLFTVGIGPAPNSWFMRKAAEIGRGSHTHIGRLEEVDQRMSRLWSQLRMPAVSDICVDWGAGAEYYPEVIPDLYSGQPLWLVAKLPLEPGVIRLCGHLEGRPWELAVRPEPDGGGQTVATLWAQRKIEALQDSIMFGADAGQVRDVVTDLALQHGLLTQYTSLVAVDRTPVRPADAGLARSDIPSLLPAGSSRQVAGFPATATGWRARALLAALTLLIATALFWLSGARLPTVNAGLPAGAAR